VSGGSGGLEGIAGGAVVEKVWKLAYVPVTANVMLRTHWRGQRQERKTWSVLIATVGPAPRRAPWKARVVIQVQRPSLQDPDNATASVKPILDAMVGRGWLTDDSSVHLELEVREEVSRVAGTTIKWTVLEERG
jgi:hypothetical protein